MTRRRGGLALVSVSVAFLAAGCGAVPHMSADDGNPARGKVIFKKPTLDGQPGCGTCHTLANAGATGTVGPNLDQAKPSFDLVVHRVTLGQGGMPSFKDQLQPQQIADVAEFVSSSAGG